MLDQGKGAELCSCLCAAIRGVFNVYGAAERKTSTLRRNRPPQNILSRNVSRPSPSPAPQLCRLIATPCRKLNFNETHIPLNGWILVVPSRSTSLRDRVSASHPPGHALRGLLMHQAYSAIAAATAQRTYLAVKQQMHRMIFGSFGRRSHRLASTSASRSRQQFPSAGIVRARSSRYQTNANGNGNKTTTKKDESHLNWKERSEAPRWMQRIAPTRGGKLSELKWYEAAALTGGCAVFYWAWFVAEPPSPQPVVVAQVDKLMYRIEVQYLLHLASFGISLVAT